MRSIHSWPVTVSAKTFVLGLMLCLASLGTASALDVPWNNTPYTHYSDDEPLEDVISALMTSQGIPVVVSGQISSKIHLDFREVKPSEFFNHLMSTHQLTWYYDGQMLYVYKVDEIGTGSLRLNHLSVSEFSAMLEELGILDTRFSWRKAKSDQLVYFSGPERFIALVMEMADVLDVKQPRKPTARARREGPAVYRWEDDSGHIRFSTKKPSTQSKSLKAKPVSRPKKTVRHELRKPARKTQPVSTRVIKP